MPRSVLLLLALTSVTAVVGFGGLAGSFVGIVKFLFFACLVVFVICIIGAWKKGEVGKKNPPSSSPPWPRSGNRPPGSR